MDFLGIGITLVVIALVVVSLLLMLVIMMQRPKQEGLGAAFGASMTDAAFGARTTDVLQKGTVYLGILFFVLSLGLGLLMGKQNAEAAKSFADQDAAKAQKDKVEEAAGADATSVEDMVKKLTEGGGENLEDAKEALTGEGEGGTTDAAVTPPVEVPEASEGGGDESATETPEAGGDVPAPSEGSTEVPAAGTGTAEGE